MGGTGRDARATPDQARALGEWFYNWELRGRGWQYWNYAADVEPPFRPLFDPSDGMAPGMDPAGLHEEAPPGWQTAEPGSTAAPRPGWREPWAEPAGAEDAWHRLSIAAPGSDFDIARLAAICEPIAERLRQTMVLEIASTAGTLSSSALLRDEDRAAFAETSTLWSTDLAGDALAALLGKTGCLVGIREIALRREFLIPLPSRRSGETAVLKRLSDAMARLGGGEGAAVQIFVKRVRAPWPREMLRAALGPSDAGLFEDDMVAPCRRKIAGPLFAVVVRLAGVATTMDHAGRIARDLAMVMSAPASDSANALILLPEGKTLRDDLVERITRRSGMILNAAELATILPVPDRTNPRDRSGDREPLAASAEGAPLGVVLRQSRATPLLASLPDRQRHMVVTGSAAESRLNFLLRLMLHDLHERHGLALIDCEGQLADLAIRHLPRHRLGDVSLLDPPRTPIPLNLLHARSQIERTILEGEVIAALSSLSRGWGAPTSTLFVDTIAALRDLDETPTLLDMRRALAGRDGPARSASAAALIEAIDQLLDWGGTRTIVSGTGRSLDFERLLRGGVLVARMESREIPVPLHETVARLLLAKFHQAFIASESDQDAERRPFFLYIHAPDPATAYSAQALFGIARRCGIGLVISHPPDDQFAPGEPVRGSGLSLAHILVHCDDPLGTAQVRLGASRREIQIPVAPMEPRDGAQRSRDALSVTARRYGLTGHAFAVADETRWKFKIARTEILPPAPGLFARFPDLEQGP